MSGVKKKWTYSAGQRPGRGKIRPLWVKGTLDARGFEKVKS